MHVMQKQYADLHEEFQIMSAKLTQVTSEKESLNQKLRDNLWKTQNLNDKIQDKDEKIEQMNSKMEILNEENSNVKESYEKLLSKLTYIQENNILIPKDGAKRGGNMKGDDQQKMVGDEDYLSNLQEEVRKLHYQLKQKDVIIEKMKGVFNEPRINVDEGESDQMKKMKSLI
mmetsp:Transcript_28516/g.27488  ORF Transcript_28516/g.27488 Transcript_28516/m.27488 type:complete len:172 (+) Transcript_28516:1102-1617(+)